MATPKPQDPNDPILPPNLPLPPSDEDQATIASLANTKPVDPRSILGDQVAPGESIPGSKMHEAGKLAYASLMPKITADPGSTDYFRQRQEQIEFEKNHPYGAPISKHPGTFGTIMHGLAKAGNIAGDILAPGTMSLIPGTDMNRRGQELENLAGIEHGQAEDAKEKQAQGELENAQARTKIEKQNADTEAQAEKDKQKGKSLIHETDQGIFLVDPDTKEATPLTYQGKPLMPKQKPEADKTPPHITVMGKDGKSHIMERDPKTGEYSIDRGEAPPNYAMVAPSLKTIDVLSPETGMPTVTTLSGKELGISGTGGYGHEAAQASAANRAGEELISDIQANKDQLGTLGAWVKKYGLNTPIADPKLAQLQSELATFAALQPAMHGFRSHSALETFDSIIGGLQKNPDATIASIRGILKTAGALNPALNKSHGDSQSGGAKDFGEAPVGKAEGSTGTLPDGTKVIVKGGRIVAR